MTKEKLLQEFPEYRPTVYSSSMEDDFIYPIFTHYDQLELEELYLEKINTENMQLQLFI